MTFDAKMTFDKDLRSVSIDASHMLGILRKSSRLPESVAHCEMLSRFCPAVFGVPCAGLPITPSAFGPCSQGYQFL